MCCGDPAAAAGAELTTRSCSLCSGPAVAADAPNWPVSAPWASWHGAIHCYHGLLGHMMLLCSNIPITGNNFEDACVSSTFRMMCEKMSPVPSVSDFGNEWQCTPRWIPRCLSRPETPDLVQCVSHRKQYQVSPCSVCG